MQEGPVRKIRWMNVFELPDYLATLILPDLFIYFEFVLLDKYVLFSGLESLPRLRGNLPK